MGDPQNAWKIPWKIQLKWMTGGRPRLWTPPLPSKIWPVRGAESPHLYLRQSWRYFSKGKAKRAKKREDFLRFFMMFDDV